MQFAGLEALFGIQAHLLGQTAVVSGHGGLAQALAQVPGQAFGQASGVDEYQGGAVFTGQLREAIVDQLPHVVGHHRRERHQRHFDRQVTGAGVADIHNGAITFGAN